MGNDNSILIVVLAVIAYFTLISKPGIAAGKAVAPAATAAVKTITTGIERNVCTWWEWILSPAACQVAMAIPTSIPEAANSPQTPSPTATKCPWDASLLIGDRRCGTQIIDYPTAPTDPGCVSGEYYLDVPTGIFKRCP